MRLYNDAHCVLYSWFSSILDMSLPSVFTTLARMELMPSFRLQRDTVVHAVRGNCVVVINC
jgi:hypothetical protein